MPPDDRERVRHMLDAAREAMEFSAGRTRDDLDSDRILALALTRLVEIIGEAAKNVSSAVRTTTPEIRWKDIGGARDRLAHGYYSVDLDILWGIMTRDLPALEPPLVALLARLDPPEARPLI